MAKTRSQVKRKVVKRDRPPTKPINRAGCEHVRVDPDPSESRIIGYRVHGTGFATFAWDHDQMADTPRFVCSICKASTPLPGLIVKRGDHG